MFVIHCMDDQIQKLQVKLGKLNPQETYLYFAWRTHAYNFTFTQHVGAFFGTLIQKRTQIKKDNLFILDSSWRCSSWHQLIHNSPNPTYSNWKRKVWAVFWVSLAKQLFKSFLRTTILLQKLGSSGKISPRSLVTHSNSHTW